MRAALAWLVLTAVVVTALACGGFVYEGLVLAGHIRRADGSAVAGVTVRITWPEDAWLGSATCTTDDAGRYGFWVGKPYLHHAANWRHVAVTPELAGFTFAPPTIDLVLASDVRNADFTASPTAATTMLRIVEIRWLEPTPADGDARTAVRILELAR